MNSYWIAWIGRLRRARSVSSFCDFRKWPFVIKPNFLLFEARISCVFLIFLLRSIKAYLCPNIINFDAVDFTERRPDEVISFFWRSVYIIYTTIKTKDVCVFVWLCVCVCVMFMQATRSHWWISFIFYTIIGLDPEGGQWLFKFKSNHNKTD